MFSANINLFKCKWKFYFQFHLFRLFRHLQFHFHHQILLLCHLRRCLFQISQQIPDQVNCCLNKTHRIQRSWQQTTTNQNPFPFQRQNFIRRIVSQKFTTQVIEKFLLDIVVLNFPYFFIRQFDISSVTLFLFLVFLYHIIVDIFELYLFLGTSGTFKMKLFFISISY